MRRDLDGLPGDDLADAVGRAAPALRALDGAALFVTGGRASSAAGSSRSWRGRASISGSTSPSRC